MIASDRQSIFGDTYNGVPNPQIPFEHPYPTRYHGPIFTTPRFGMPFISNPYAKAPFSDATVPTVSPLVVGAREVAQSAITGAIVGAVIGAVVGGDNKRVGRVSGALIGGGIPALVGLALLGFGVAAYRK